MTIPDRLTRAISLLAAHGYTVTPPAAPVGRPRSATTEQIETLAESGATTAEILRQTGLPRSTVDMALTRWRRRKRG